MGIFDSLFGTNTNAASNAALGQSTGMLWQQEMASNKALQDTTGQANAALQGTTAAGQNALTGGYNSAINALGSYGAAAQGILGGATQAGVGAATAGNSAFQPYADAGGAASKLYAGALGLDGPAGTAAAQSAFQASPGYQFQVDQSTNAAQRAAAASGMSASGSTLDAITRLGSNLANTEYQTFLGNLSNLGSQGLTAASGLSTNDRAAATLYGNQGTTGAALAQSLGNNIGNAYASQGTGNASLLQSLGQGLSSNDTALGRGMSNNALNTANEVAGLTMNNANRQDNATNADNGIFSKLLGSVLSTPLGGGSSFGGKLLSNAFSL